jgi:hypothetical protein
MNSLSLSNSSSAIMSSTLNPYTLDPCTLNTTTSTQLKMVKPPLNPKPKSDSATLNKSTKSIKMNSNQTKVLNSPKLSPNSLCDQPEADILQRAYQPEIRI